MPHRSEFPSRDEVFGHLRALVEGHGNRDAIASWAERYMPDDQEVTDWPAWDALQALAGADAPTTDREWLYGQEDFEDWLARLMSAVQGERGELLRRAGLIALGTVDDVVAPAVAWERRRDGEIAEVVDIAVDAAWLRLARERGLSTADGEFLISTAGAAEQALPWARVRLGEWPRVAEVVEGRAFVAMAVDGARVCWVVPEDHGVTIRFAARS
ncbi:hypothetical protein [Actinocrispum sp. NPDC049592]|uniref:hypothetical protein n=1 Tax=Actinocrispum sp. NPDC049592 TaxID=3154835 RepID=UPI00343D505C